jgi:hypothetical protein
MSDSDKLPEIRKLRSFARWAGDTTAVVSLFRMATSFVQQRIHQAPDVQVLLSMGPHDEERYYSIAQFEEKFKDLESRLPEIRGIVASIGATGDTNIAATLEVSKGMPAAMVQVIGSDRVIVEGIRGELAELLSRGARWPKSLNAQYGQYIVMAVAVLFGVLFSALVLNNVSLDFLPDNTFGGIMAAILTLVALYGSLALIFRGFLWLLPSFELLPAGGKTRWERSKVKVLAGIGTLLGALLVAFLTNWFGWG